MRNRLVITLCAVVSLLAGAGLLTFWLVRSLAPAAALNYTPWPLSPEPYTQTDLDEALALRTEGYEAQSVAAFDRALADWTNEAAFHAREERIRRLLCSYEEDGPEAEFVLGTLAAARGAWLRPALRRLLHTDYPGLCRCCRLYPVRGRIRRLLRGL